MQPIALKRKSSAVKSSATSDSSEHAIDGFTKVLSREEKRKQRKVERHRPQFQYDTSYFRTGKKIGIAHIRDLALYIVSDAQKPSWIVVDHPSAVSHVVIILASGLLPDHLGIPTLPLAASLPFQTSPSTLLDSSAPLPKARVPVIPKLFTYGCPTRAPGDNRKLHSVMSVLLQSPIPQHMKKKRETESKRLTDLAKLDQTSPLLYLLTANQMTANNYRLPSYLSPSNVCFVPGEVPPQLSDILHSSPHQNDTAVQALDFVSTVDSTQAVVVIDEQGRRRKGNIRGEEGWVETPEAVGQPPGGVYPVLAIDCEMCLSDDGQELARVSVVDLTTGDTVFDELVTPPKPVTDYLTQWSGITAERLALASHTLESVQEALVTGPNPLITSHTILLGHSLDCDLAALKIKHPLVIDTTVIYRHARGPPYKPGLKWLAQKWLGRTIQAHEGGHDSAEDARACVDLLKLKLINGPDFGDPSVDNESIFERVSRSRNSANSNNKSSLVCDYGNPRGWYGAKATNAIACNSDDEIVEALCSNVASHDLSFARLTELGNIQHWTTDLSSEDDFELSASGEIDAALERFNGRLARIHSALPPNSALILLNGHSDPRPMRALIAKRQRWERSFNSKEGIDGIAPEDKWMTDDDRELERVVAEAREGMAFFCVK